ncbi:hypothetical protein GQ43DRAFT_482901 [Delitschia confertaspora ATCC 74209]|uniref:Utp8 beta-propeller domain-containing protein n=1 Tax=Delitschia confertaspora ATCC 74209 TaxID=1513339 RepID=A0A9P4JGS6_9PLEO|nr:hypothetical protein GQ43DRAFT_482901 [Delitschia confertaspora ATCC 74209]
MSSSKEIEAPYILASLPKPVDSTNGRTQLAGVYSLSGSRKRKRTEVAVGTDGEGVFIYSVQNPQLVTSYAVPPQTYFTAAPCSLYRKGTSKRPSCRFTYAPIIQSIPGEKPQLICFTEELQKDNANTPVKTSFTIPDSAAKLVSIEIIPVAVNARMESDSHDVLAIFDNGRAICLSSRLEELRWDTSLRLLSSEEGSKSLGAFQIEHVTLTTAKATLRGLLKNRDDIAAILDPTLDGTSEILEIAPVLAVVFRRSNAKSSGHGMRILGLFQVQPRSSDIITSHDPPVKHLVSVQFPRSDSSVRSIASNHESSFSLHITNGRLHQLEDGVLTSYDFSETVPKVSSELELSGSDIKSFVRVSSDLVLAMSQNSCGIYDVKYNSVQAVLPLGAGIEAQNATKKRKQLEDGALNGEPGLLPNLGTFFAELGLAVGISNHELTGVQLVGGLARKRVKVDGSLLIDSIGKGIRSKELSSGITNQYSGTKPVNGYIVGPTSALQSESWKKRVSKLDKLVSKGKIFEFEELFARELNVQLVPTSVEDGESKTEEKPLTNGVGENNSPDQTLKTWQLPKIISDADRQRHRQQAIYALGKIFSWNSEAPVAEEEPRKGAHSPSSIRVEFLPPNVFQWLLLSGSLTKESIQRSLLEAFPERQARTGSLSDGDIVKAIVEFDPELYILSAVLNHSTFLPVGEVVQAIKLLIQSLNDRPKAEPTSGLLTNGVDVPEYAMDVDVAGELDAATHDLDHALAVLDNGVTIRNHTLRPALIRLHTFPATTITTTLRSSLSRPELEALIRLLQFELKNGGWTSPYDFADSESPDHDDSSEDPDDHAVAIIASLINCSLDAIGTGAWLATVGGSTLDETTEELIDDLYQETSLALNGFWEARFMRGLLSEFLRYAFKSSTSQKPSNRTLQNQGKPLLAGNTLEHDLPMLPLGGKVDLGVEKTKLGRSGRKEERSAREMGMLISKRVPKYSLERIVL